VPSESPPDLNLFFDILQKLELEEVFALWQTLHEAARQEAENG
jgi:hypothetical protein